MTCGSKVHVQNNWAAAVANAMTGIDAANMQEVTEQKSVVRITADLLERFPDVPAGVIEKFVEDAHLKFAGAPMRD